VGRTDDKENLVFIQNRFKDIEISNHAPFAPLAPVFTGF